MSEKLVIVINGSAGVGKDTLCEFAASEYKTMNVSSITPILSIARAYGWDGVKDAKGRKLLAQLKKAFTDYNDYPLQYLCDKYSEFVKNDDKIMFVHIREGSAIKKFRDRVDLPCVTLLVHRNAVDCKVWGNASDDSVEDFDYDYHYGNECPLSEAKDDFLCFLQSVLSDVFCVNSSVAG